MRKRPRAHSSSEPVPESTTEVSSPRVRIPDVVPTGWLDRLLVTIIDLPLAKGERAVVDAVIDTVSSILPTHAVGAYLGPEAGSAGTEPMVVKRLPGQMTSSEVSGEFDPTRMFPGLGREYVVPVPGSAGSTLHVASDDNDLEPDSSPAVHLLERAAMALGRALPEARAVAARGRPALDAQMMQTDKLATFGQIAAGVVHELNNPLTSIVAYSEYLIRKASGPVGPDHPAAAHRIGCDPEDLERLRRIHEAANHMLRFTRDIVSYARPSTGMAGAVALHEVIDLAIGFCDHVLTSSSVRAERRFSPDVGTLHGAREQLVQVFINLLTNACQAAPEGGGRVVIATSLETGSPRPIVIEVADNGAGIAPEHLGHIFAPFFTTKGHKNGTGLGLSIVKSIVESHEGTIRVESHLGRGTRFVIQLPLPPR
jgi:two-component system, NtrC family, sensor kinase